MVSCAHEKATMANKKVLDRRELLADIRQIRLALKQAKRKQLRPMRQFLKDLAKEYGISLR